MFNIHLFSVVMIVLLALLFDFANGYRDAADSITTIVSTRVLSPIHAVIWATIFNFLAFFIFGTAVAETIGEGMIKLETISKTVIFSGLVGTIIWDLITWHYRVPTSSSHALIGGFAGAAIAKSGFKVLIAGGWYKTVAFLILAPALALFLGVFFLWLVSWLVHKQTPCVVSRKFRVLQFVSTALYNLGHGANDAQKTMGIIAALLFVSGYMKHFHVEHWVVLISHTAIAIGTFLGGWNIVKQMNQKITKLRPVDGFCAETASAGAIFLSTYLGIPVSSTHVVTGAISGVGAAKRLSAVRWGVSLRIIWAWILTIPLSGLFAYLTFLLVNFIKTGL